MYLGGNEIRRNVRGTFKKVYYRCTIKRTDKTESLKCFVNNDLEEFTTVNFMYCRSQQDGFDLVQDWNRQQSTYYYKLIDSVSIKKPFLSIDDVIEDYFSMRMGSIISYSDTNREMIH